MRSSRPIAFDRSSVSLRALSGKEPALCTPTVGDVRHDPMGRTQPRQSQLSEQHGPYGSWDTRPEGMDSNDAHRTRFPSDPFSSSNGAPRYGGGLPCGTVIAPAAGRQPIALSSDRDSTEPTKGPLLRLQQQQEQQRQESPSRRYVVKAHKPEVPDDQKRSVEQLQESVMLKVGDILAAAAQQYRDDEFYGYDSYDFPASGGASAERGGGSEDEGIQAIKMEISGDISNAFRDIAAAQNDKIFQAEGLLKEARRKIDILL